MVPKPCPVLWCQNHVRLHGHVLSAFGASQLTSFLLVAFGGFRMPSLNLVVTMLSPKRFRIFGATSLRNECHFTDPLVLRRSNLFGVRPLFAAVVVRLPLQLLIGIVPVAAFRWLPNTIVDIPGGVNNLLATCLT